MKLVLVSLVAAVLIINTNAQFSPLLPGFGLGFPGLPFFPGFFGRVFPPFIPRLRPGLGFRGRMFIGKRDVESQLTNATVHGEHNSTVHGEHGVEGTNSTVNAEHIDVTKAEDIVVVDHQSLRNNRTVCNVSSSTHLLSCTGFENLECPVTPVFHGFENLKLRIFHLLPKPVEGSDSIALWKVVHGKENRNFTFVHPVTHTNELLFIHSNETSTLPGFLVKNETCFTQFLSFVKGGVLHENLRFTLSFN
jgi:hypothetical protein